jgi:hypothetical protein
MKVFWSWQSDTLGKIGRHFVRNVLEEAIKDLKEQAEIEAAQRDGFSGLHLDQDRKGVPGSPDLARLILEKIDQSAVVVADVTPIGAVQGSRRGKRQKKLINSNVAIEVGYALRAHSDRALLMVLNEHYGDRADLPFDLQSKAGPIAFNLPPEADKEQIAKAAGKLRGQLKEALGLCLSNRVPQVQKQGPFPETKPKDGLARFRAAGEAIGIQWSCLGLGSEESVFLIEGPALWLRLMAKKDPGRLWPSHELCQKAMHAFRLQPFSPRLSLHGVRADDGFGQYKLLPTGAGRTPSLTPSVAFAFETGEVWSVDTAYLQSRDNVIPFLEDAFIKQFNDYSQYIASLGIDPPYRWICGLEGIGGFRLKVPVPTGHIWPWEDPQCLSANIVKEGEYDGKQTPTSALLPFFELVFQKCGLPRPSHLPRE